MSKTLITSALPYVNGVPHLGHMVGCLLPSDVYARFMRMMGNEVLYICGTDEHGTPSEVGAAKEGMDIGEYCTNITTATKRPMPPLTFLLTISAAPAARRIRSWSIIFLNSLTKTAILKKRPSNRYIRLTTGAFCRIAM